MSTRVKADIMISRHAGSDGHLKLVRLDDPSTQVLPLIRLWTGRTDQGIAQRSSEAIQVKKGDKISNALFKGLRMLVRKR